MPKKPKDRFYIVSLDGNRTIVCERHLSEKKLKGNGAQFVGVGLSCRFCREEEKVHKALWQVIPR